MTEKERYDHRVIEKKWQSYWAENKTFRCEVDHSKPKYYCLDMFPYPSGSGLHVGHVVGYTATDIVSRHKRQLGFNVLHPMGWDSFGLPAEQYAIRTGTHPAETTKANIENFKRQLLALGFSYDWDREFMTSEESFYKWTQWIFTKLFERGLAYEAEMMVNFCPALGTVLANEEVHDGKSVEGGHAVERRPLKQWVLKITEYADRLLEDLDGLDWPEGLKRLQSNWIGRSQGARVHFPLKSGKEKITVFTTRPDTLFGATYMVLAPEHPLVEQLCTDAQRSEVQAYIKKAMQKSELQRADLDKSKTGVFTGGYAINPVNGEKLPVWVADYVLMGYGTGAIMAVPAHDERDHEFAMHYDLPINVVYDVDVSKHPELVPEGMDIDELQKRVSAGQICWPDDGHCINSASKDISLNGLGVAEAKERMNAYLAETGKGEPCVTYKLRDWLFARQRYWGEPFPVLHLEDGTTRVLELDELPLTPPEIADYTPSPDGRSPLAKAPEWVEITDPKTGKKALRDTNTMPQWAGSCWYYLRFCDARNSESAWDKEKESYWMPVDLYVGGAEHAVLHLLYARFWHKVLYDCGLVSTIEPFQSLRNQGLITARSYRRENGSYVEEKDVKQDGKRYLLAESGEELISQIDKMSKSKLNGVSPDEIIDEMGADALRLYEMFLGPIEKEKPWDTRAVAGCYRFLVRLWEVATSDKLTDDETEDALKLGHRLVHGVKEDIAALQFNTAIAKMMEFLNAFSKLDAYPRSMLRFASQALAPFAPHMAEELWQRLGGEGSISYVPYPEAKAQYLEDDTITYVVQVNGKLRGRLDLPKDQERDIIVDLAKQESSIAKHLNGKEVNKVIFVPNRLLNFVVK